jgi:two-component system, NarL family, sensor kinase
LLSEGDRQALDSLHARLQRAERTAVEATARAEKIKSANDALRRSVGRLAAGDDIDSYLSGVLLSIVEELGALSGTVYSCDFAANVNWLRACVVDGRAMPARAADHPYASKPMTMIGTYDRLFPNWGTPEVSYFQHEVSEEWGLEPEYIAYLQASGARVNLVVPIVLNSELLGLFAIRFGERQQFSDEDSELFKALAYQAAVALRLWQLGEQARDAAVAREREASAEARAAKLAEANALMRRMTDVLRGTEDVDTLLGHTLKTITDLLGLHSGTAWTCDLERGALDLRFVLKNGQLVRGQDSDHPKAREPDHLDQWEWVLQGVPDRVAPTVKMVATAPDFGGPQRRYLLDRGIRRVLSIPMARGAEYIGVFAVFLDAEREPSAEELELVQVLANQAALAIQLSIVSEEARSIAVTEMTRIAARERESALEAERGRLAREIHDTLAQGFAAIAMRLTTIQREFADRVPAEVAKAVADAGDVARGYIVEARRAFAALKFHREFESLSVGLEHLVDAFRRSGEHRIELHVASTITVPDAVAFELLRIVREALNNALRHARAGGVRVELTPTPDDDGIRLVVADDGAGFDPDGRLAGFGLTSMRERVEEIGASLTIISAPGEGTEIIVTWYARTGASIRG